MNQNFDLLHYFITNSLFEESILKNWCERYSVKYITSIRFPGLVMLHYADVCAYDKLWTPFSLVCRGTIVDLQNKTLLAVPFFKWFNLGEMPETSYDNLAALGGFQTSEKLDGSMIIGFINPNDDKLTFTTKGCFRYRTRLPLWDGGSIEIGEIVSKNLTPMLIGKNEKGNLVPTQVVKRFNNGSKYDWLNIYFTPTHEMKPGIKGKKLQVTPNHKIFTDRGELSASEIKIGDSLISYANSPDSFVLHLIESSLLGDGHILRNQGKYTESHTQRHKEYVDHISQWLGNCLCSKDITLSGKGSVMLRVVSKQYHALSTLRKKWYPNGKKIVPQDLSWMDDFAVAKWYMDDGTLHKEKRRKTGHFSALFATNGFQKEEVERLAAKLREMYTIDCKVYYDMGWVIRINYRKGTIYNFWKAISPHVVPCMRYKLPSEYQDSILWKHIVHKGNEFLQQELCPVIKIEKMPLPKKVWPCRFNAFDLETTTHNYMCSGVLVHNSFDSEHGAYANALPLTDEQLVALRAYAEYGTLMFELIAKPFQIVVDYKKKGYKEGLYLIGYRHNVSNKLASFEDLARMAFFLDLPTFKTYQFNGLDQLIALAKDLPVLDEGFVLRLPGDLMVKVKGSAYLAAHRFISHLSDRNILEAVADGTASNLAQLAPEEYREDVLGKIDHFQKRVAELENECYTLFSKAPKEGPRKEFAFWVKANVPPHFKGFLFQLLDGKVVDRKQMFKVLEEIDNIDGKTRI